MSESRNKEEIQKEYNNLCAVIGEKSFRAEVLKSEVSQAYNRILELGKEMEKAVKQEGVPSNGEQQPQSAAVASAA